MMVSTKGRYALRIMADLAQQDKDRFTSLRDIAGRQDISMKYLEMIIGILNKGKLVNSHRGKSGGYKLAKSPDEYTVGEILKLAEGHLVPVQCLEGDNMCHRAGYCLTLPMWKNLDKLIDDYVENITLADLIEGKV